ncbi:hypothetical protein GCM10027396_27280 [Insolitispirillum peregrinum]
MEDALFHQGELTLQDRVGSRERLSMAAAKLIRPALSEKHQAFFSALPWVLLAGQDPTGRLWASLRYGEPGFIRVLAPDVVQIRGQALTDDPLAGAWRPGQTVAMLGLAAHIQRRNRVNGVILEVNDGGITLSVQQSYGNCPKYITPRLISLLPLSEPQQSWPVETGQSLSATARALIQTADTLFIASAHPGEASASRRAQGADISHRGGDAGFVGIQPDGSLVLPDYSGNQYFNTLGNILLNRQVGLLLIDTATARPLWIRAEAHLCDDPGAVAKFPRAERLLILSVTEWRLAHSALPLCWQPVPQDGCESLSHAG